jgi:hypothetical protein
VFAFDPFESDALRRFTREQQELHWFFNEYEEDIGVTSNFSALVSRMMRGGDGGDASPPRLSPDPFGMASAERARKVRRRLESLEQVHAQALELCLGQGIPEEVVQLGVGAALAPQTRVAVEAWRHSGSTRSLVDWVSRLPKRLDELGVPVLVEQVKTEADALLVAALAAYRDAGRKGVAHAS